MNLLRVTVNHHDEQLQFALELLVLRFCVLNRGVAKRAPLLERALQFVDLFEEIVLQFIGEFLRSALPHVLVFRRAAQPDTHNVLRRKRYVLLPL